MRHRASQFTVITACLLGLVASAVAQPGPGMGQRGMGAGHRPGMEPPMGHDPATRLTQDLGLDEDQAEEVRAIFEVERVQLEALGEATDEEFCTIHAETRTQLAAVLDEEQQSQLREIEARHERRPPPNHDQGRKEGERGNRQGRGPGGMDAKRPGPPVCPFN